MEKTGQATSMHTDPVCGMEVDAESAAGKSEYRGQTYFFCCDGCKEEFDAHPQQYLPH